MRCSTCGEQLDGNAVRCPTCGAGVTRGALTSQVPVRRCPRCGYMGEGIGYFRRPGHLALRVGSSFFYGIPGLIYYMSRRNRNICPKCGLGWEHAGQALVRGGALPEFREVATGMSENESLPRSGIGRRALGVSMKNLPSFNV